MNLNCQGGDRIYSPSSFSSSTTISHALYSTPANWLSPSTTSPESPCSSPAPPSATTTPCYRHDFYSSITTSTTSLSILSALPPASPTSPSFFPSPTPPPWTPPWTPAQVSC